MALALVIGRTSDPNIHIPDLVHQNLVSLVGGCLADSLEKPVHAFAVVGYSELAANGSDIPTFSIIVYLDDTLLKNILPEIRDGIRKVIYQRYPYVRFEIIVTPADISYKLSV